MRVHLAQQAQESLGQSDLVMLTARVDDGALLIGQMLTMGLPEILDRPLPRPGTQRGLSWGWTAVIWLASIVTAGDHRKVSVATSRTGRRHTLSPLTAQVSEPLDFRDDRWSHRLQPLRKTPSWPQSAHDVKARRLEVDTVAQAVLRCDATTVSGAHTGTAEGLGQVGQSQDEPTRPQLTVMMGSLEPWGMPLATDVVAGERADEGLDLPRIERLRSGVQTPGLVFVGDGKMRAWATRA